MNLRILAFAISMTYASAAGYYADDYDGEGPMYYEDQGGARGYEDYGDYGDYGGSGDAGGYEGQEAETPAEALEGALERAISQLGGDQENNVPGDEGQDEYYGY